MSNRSALIIEDELKLAELFSIALQAEFETQIIYEGSAALDYLSETTPDLIILDLHLPRLSGKDILDHIRADKRLADSKVLVVTADALTGASIKEQADIVLLKPFSVNQLRGLAEQLVPDRFYRHCSNEA